MIGALLLALLADSAPGVFVLGIDGMDPVILQRLMDEGRMPNFARLAREGAFRPLGTSEPPQSPVAWSSFVTGLDPGGHGVFDFIHRDPKTYAPISSATAPTSGDPPASVSIFGYILPLGSDEVANNRSGATFWDLLQAAGVPVEVYRMPGNYPPTPSEALTLTGMGTVDMRGDAGTYTWFTDEPILETRHLKADLQRVTVDDEDFDGTPDTVRSRLKGPPDVFHLRPREIPSQDDYLSVPVVVHVDPVEETIWIRCGEADAILREGEWSDWLQVDFDALPAGMLPLAGNVRFYAKEVRPVFRLYASPLNIAPGAPAQPITTPDEGIEMLHGELGDFYTLGMPEETNALKDRLFDDDDYLSQIALVHRDGERILDLALSRFDRGDTTFVYLSDIDLQCHMLWRHADPKYSAAPRHPAFEAEAAAKHAGVIEDIYAHVDEILARVREQLPPDALLIVMSDHGFQPFTRKLHLNSWLRDNGYLALKDGRRTGSIAVGDVDWASTRAYGMGFNGLYLNLRGREGQGIVDPAQAPALMDEIGSKLQAYLDPKTGGHPVKRVSRATEVYSGARMADAPDMIVGYDSNYGCSEESTLGEIVEAQMEDNTDRWSGNHLMAPEVVPGILLANRALSGRPLFLTDVTVSLLDAYGLPAAPGMIGRSIFKD